MGKLLFILLLLLQGILDSHSQVLTQTLKGTVTDRETKMPGIKPEISTVTTLTTIQNT